MLKSGVYMYTNLLNGKKYIGESVDLVNRHKTHMRDYKTKDTKFYRAIRKYGIENFYYQVLEYIEPNKEVLLDKEAEYKEYYDTYQNGYNSIPGRESYYKTGGNKKTVYQYDRYGNYIRSHESAASAARNIGNHRSNISACCKEKVPSAGGYVWRYEKHKKIDAVHIDTNMKKAVIQYTKDDRFVAIFPSGAEAHRQTGVNASTISRCCNGKQKTAGGFKWQFYNDF